MMKKRLRILLICSLILSLCVGAAAEDRPAVRVDDVSYTVDEVQVAYAIQLSTLYSAEYSVTEETASAVMQQVLDSFVTRGLVEKRVQALKLDSMTENKRQQLLEQARQSYDEYWQQMRAGATQDQMTDAQVTAFLENSGITVDWLYQELIYNDHVQTLMRHEGYVLEVSDEEVDTFYETYYVKPFRDRYENDVPLFENEILIPSSETLYLPDGYRLIHQLVLPVTQEFATQLETIETQAAAVQEQMQTLYAAVAESALKGTEVSGTDRDAYLTLQDEYDRLTVQHDGIWSAFYLSQQDTLSEIETRLQTGESFDGLCESFGGRGADIVFHPDSIYLPDEIAESLRTLQTIGDVSQPCLYSDGIHIFCYAEDMQSGALPLTTDENKSVVRMMAAQAKLDEFLAEQTDKLRDRVEIVIDTSGLTY